MKAKSKWKQQPALSCYNLRSLRSQQWQFFISTLSKCCCLAPRQKGLTTQRAGIQDTGVSEGQKANPLFFPIKKCVCKHEPCCKDDTHSLVALLMSKTSPADSLAQIEKCRKDGTGVSREVSLGAWFVEICSGKVSGRSKNSNHSLPFVGYEPNRCRSHAAKATFFRCWLC